MTRPLVPVAGDLLLSGAAQDRLDQNRLVGGCGGQGAQLGQGAVEHEVGWNDAQTFIQTRAFDFLVDRARQGGQTRQIGVGVFLGLDLVLAVQEVGDIVIGPLKLVDDIGRARRAASIFELVRCGRLAFQTVLDDLAIELVGAIQGRRIDGL